MEQPPQLVDSARAAESLGRPANTPKHPRYDRRSTEVGSLWEPLRTAAEAAGYLRLHPKTVVRMARTQMIPAIRIGKQWRFRISDLTAWAASQVQSARQPFE